MTATTAPAVPLRSSARTWFSALAVWAWLGLAIQFVLSSTGMYPSDPTKPSAYGWNPAGIEGLVPRVIDFFSYFTIWSNIAVEMITVENKNNLR